METKNKVNNPGTVNGESKELAIIPDAKVMPSDVVVRNNSQMLESFDVSKGMPNLEKEFEALPLDLMAGYWTPKDKGEMKRVLFDCLEEIEYVNEATGEVKTLLCAFFLEGTNIGTKDAKIIRISNGSKRLVGVMQSKNPPQGTAFQITYLGKKKNTKNEFSSDDWQVFPLKATVKIR